MGPYHWRTVHVCCPHLLHGGRTGQVRDDQRVEDVLDRDVQLLPRGRGHDGGFVGDGEEVRGTDKRGQEAYGQS